LDTSPSPVALERWGCEGQAPASALFPRPEAAAAPSFSGDPGRGAYDPYVPVRLHNITFDCAHLTELARWWTNVTGWEEDPGNPNLPEDDEAALVAPDRSLNLLFVKVPEAKAVKNRVHLDLQSTDAARRRGPAARRTRGDEFCVERSAEERAAAPIPPS
jgi:Glyoxalase-like domain